MGKKTWKEFGDAITRIENIGNDMQNLYDAGNLVLGNARERCSGFKVTSGELKNSLSMTVTDHVTKSVAHIGTNKQYATYVEFGTGPKGQANHAGIAPDVKVVYTQSPWWIHESMVPPGAGDTYHWQYIDTDNGRFYKVSGQPAHPYLYPAFNDNKDAIADILAKGLKGAIEGK